MNATNTSRKTVQGFICLEILNTNGASLPRPGQPVIYNPYHKRVMLQNLQGFPKLTFNERHKQTGLDMSNSTIKLIARSNKLYYWRVKLRPELTPEVAALRLA
jgi:hypothetical protein